ncbi:sensor histidine kinase [Lawsonibacter sp. LCP25S3_G6]|uniref:sensor histidine kinase n=1 Tax=unclassified Lawsonibacter TaxID=2617946 RepID=UPI003F9A2130
MKKLQGNPWGKLLAVILLLTAAFGAGHFAVKGILNIPYVITGDWQQTDQFYNLLWERQEQLAQLCSLDMQLAGELSFADQQQKLQTFSQLKENLQSDATWFRWQVFDSDGQQVLYSNLDQDALNQVVEEIHYATFTAGEHLVTSSVETQIAAVESYELAQDGGSFLTVEAVPASGEQLVIQCGVPDQVDDTIQDEFFELWKEYGENRANFRSNLVQAGMFALLSLGCFLYILWTSGHKEGEEEIVLTWQERIFFDLYLPAMVAAGVGLFLFGLYWADYLAYGLAHQESSGEFIPLVRDWLLPLTVAMMVGVVTLLSRTLTVRLKARALARSTLLCRVLMWLVRVLGDFFRSLPITWRTVGVFAGYVVVSSYLLLAAPYSALSLGLWGLVNLGTLVFLGWWTMNLRKLRMGTQAIAAGDMEHRVDTVHMPRDLKLQAEDLNNISVGLAGAVDEKMKSERFKAELITNVSHDLKTPLTSIINYVNLLKTTEQTDPTAQEYIEVLDRKSQRLKKLTEDLVEASKASTGVLSVNREKIGMAQLISQAMGEWEERLQDRKLTVVTNLPEGETWVYADGRHLWRVMDNLLSNCAKYAMEGTRVYLDLSRGKGQVCLSIKNISREPLNIPAQRLMERFVRGEESRTTEGSGLGLSIARSLTELQGGQFELAVDGDLFKASVTLPQAN